MFGNKYVQFRNICPLLRSIIIDTFYVDPHSNQRKNSQKNPPISRHWSAFPSWLRRTFGGVIGLAYKLSSCGSFWDPLSVHLMRRFVLVACQFHLRSPLAMPPVVPVPPLISSLGLTFRASTGFLPPPTRILPASLPLSYRRCSPRIRVTVFNLLSRGLAVSSLRTYASGRTKLWSFCALFPDLFSSSPAPTLAYQLRTPFNQVNHYLRVILSRAGVLGPGSLHTFRVGAATLAAAAGLPYHLIQTLGRWTSQAYRRWIHTAPHPFLSVAPLL